MATKQTEVEKRMGIILRAEKYSSEYCATGDHARQAAVHELAIAAVAFKRTIAALREKLPQELAAALASVDSAL